ncbi:MAG: efflux RND transporter periplasmic adaptor subunit [Bacteroidetes bacterium]|nr:efflux RND transporter periplasmic adaptor subunit [Bacteroidota bacterium]
MSKNFKIIRNVTIALVVIGFVVWKLSSNKAEKEEKTALANPVVTVFPVTVLTAKSEIISGDFTVSGTFLPFRELSFVSETQGRVVSLMVENGDVVAQGQVIAQLDDEQVKYDLTLAEAVYQKAEDDLNRFKTMSQQGAVTKQQLADINLNYNNAKNKLNTLQRMARKSSVVAPIAGTINNLKLEVGSYLAPGSLVAEIVDVSRIKMMVKLSDAEILKIKRGGQAEVKADLFSDIKFKASVSALSVKADAAKKYDVELLIENSEKNPVKAGMTGVASFKSGEEKQAIMIPKNCLLGGVQNPSVYIINAKDTVAHVMPVVIGLSVEDRVEVIRGINVGDIVVVSGQLNLNEGNKVEVIK